MKLAKPIQLHLPSMVAEEVEEFGWIQELEKLIQWKIALLPLNAIFSTNLQAGSTHLVEKNCGSELL